jgi:hypothetical protein
VLLVPPNTAEYHPEDKLLVPEPTNDPLPEAVFERPPTTAAYKSPEPVFERPPPTKV